MSSKAILPCPDRTATYRGTPRGLGHKGRRPLYFPSSLAFFAANNLAPLLPDPKSNSGLRFRVPDRSGGGALPRSESAADAAEGEVEGEAWRRPSPMSWSVGKAACPSPSCAPPVMEAALRSASVCRADGAGGCSDKPATVESIILAGGMTVTT